MRPAFLFVLPVMLFTTCTAQTNLAFIKNGLRKVYVYDSSLKKKVFDVRAGMYFSCDSLQGDWYSFNMPYIFEGRIHRDSIQFFKTISLAKQQGLINTAFINYSKICRSSNDEIIDTLIQPIYNDSIFRNRRELYYDESFFPLLDEFYTFYRRTKNQTALLNLLNIVNCGVDGDFAENYFPLLGRCYYVDKMKFIALLNNIKSAQIKNRYRSALLEGISEFYMMGHYANLAPEQIEYKIQLEKQRILALTKIIH
jgi:hypothetical protein